MRHRLAASAAAAVVTCSLCLSASLPAQAGAAHTNQVRHVLVLSVDGMHQSDLAYYVARHPRSALAALVADGTEFTNAQTTFPSDSFPGTIAQFTGAGPGRTGLYYDDTYNHRLLPPGTVDCSTTAPGTEVAWTEDADRSQNPITLDAGQGLAAPALTDLTTNTKQQTLDSAPAITKAILKMTPTPQALLDPAALPVDPSTCLPVYPHQYLQTNTVFDVAHDHGLRTAWSDKHPAYEILDGPSGTGIQDLFTPEINSVADAAGDDWTNDNLLTREYDSIKVAAVLNEIDGYDHSGSRHVGTPAIFGMNFQTVSTAEKLPVSDGLRGGYNADGTPGPLLTQAMGYINTQVGALRARIARDGLTNSTTIILSAKHGQSPIDPATLRRVDDGAIIDAIDAAWAKSHPSAAPLVAFAVDDDVVLMWLSDRHPQALAFVKHYLLTHSAPANLVNDPKGTYSSSVARSGLDRVYVGTAADRLFDAPTNNPRTPDLVGLVQPGVVYTSKTSKIAEHGGDTAADRHVPLVIAGAGVPHGLQTGLSVQTQVIAPAILFLLGIDPADLDAVRGAPQASTTQLTKMAKTLRTAG